MTGVLPRRRNGRRSLNAKYDRLVGVSQRPHTRSRTVTAERNEERERLLARISGAADSSAAAAGLAAAPPAHRNKGTSRPQGGETGKVAEQAAVDSPPGHFIQQRQRQYQPLRRSPLVSPPLPTAQLSPDLTHMREEEEPVEEEDTHPTSRLARRLPISKPKPEYRPPPHRPQPRPPQTPTEEQVHWNPWQGFPVYGMNAWPQPLPPPQATPMPLFLTPHGMFTHSGQPVIVTNPFGVGDGRMGPPFLRDPQEHHPNFGMAHPYARLPAYQSEVDDRRPPLHKRQRDHGAYEEWEEAPPIRNKRAVRGKEGEFATQQRKYHHRREDELQGEPRDHYSEQQELEQDRVRQRATHVRYPTSYGPPRQDQLGVGSGRPPYEPSEDEGPDEQHDRALSAMPPLLHHSTQQEARSARPAPSQPADHSLVFDDAAEDYNPPSPTPSGSVYSYKTDSDATEADDHCSTQTLKPKRKGNAIASVPALSHHGASQPRTTPLSQYEPNTNGNDTMASNWASTGDAPSQQRRDPRNRHASDSAVGDELAGRKKSWFGSMGRRSYNTRVSDNQNRALLWGSPPSSPSPKRLAAMLPSSPSARPASPLVERPVTPTMRPATPTMVQTTASRLQRASERAWAALASLQPRMNGYDAVPVAQTTPAPPSPTLGPVDAVASESGSEAEASDSIEAFSDTQPEPLLLTSKPLPTLPHVRSSLSLDDDGIAPTEDDPPPRYKKVRFSLQEGDRLLNTLGADPGFKVWRDGY